MDKKNKLNNLKEEKQNSLNIENNSNIVYDETATKIDAFLTKQKEMQQKDLYGTSLTKKDLKRRKKQIWITSISLFFAIGSVTGASFAIVEAQKVGSNKTSSVLASETIEKIK